MGFFERLFGSKKSSADLSAPAPQKVAVPQPDDPAIVPTAEMMDEDLFWQIVAESLGARDEDAQEMFLINKLQSYSPMQMIGFRLRTDKLLYDTYNETMWCAAYIMKGGCSDDGFEYFRNWVISRGKDVYYAAKANPDSLVAQVSEEAEYDFESFWYVALEAFEKMTGKDLYDYIDDSFETTEGNYPPLTMGWEENDPESMKALCPRLYATCIEAV